MKQGVYITILIILILLIIGASTWLGIVTYGYTNRQDSNSDKKILFKSTQLNDKDLSNMKLYGLDLSKNNFTNSLLKNTDLTGADMSNCNMTGVDMTGANITNTNFTNCKFDNIFGKVIGSYSMTPSSELINTQIAKTQATHCIPLYWTLSTNGYFVGPKANLSNVDLGRSIFRDTIYLKKANLNNTLMDLISGIPLKINSAKIKGIPLTLPPNYQLHSGYLLGPYAIIHHSKIKHMHINTSSITPNVDLSSAEIRLSKITNCYLDSINFTNAHIKTSIITNTTFVKCNLSSTKLNNTHFINCIINGMTIDSNTFFNGTLFNQTTIINVVSNDSKFSYIEDLLNQLKKTKIAAYDINKIIIPYINTSSLPVSNNAIKPVLNNITIVETINTSNTPDEYKIELESDYLGEQLEPTPSQDDPLKYSSVSNACQFKYTINKLEEKEQNTGILNMYLFNNFILQSPSTPYVIDTTNLDNALYNFKLFMIYLDNFTLGLDGSLDFNNMKTYTKLTITSLLNNFSIPNEYIEDRTGTLIVNNQISTNRTYVEQSDYLEDRVYPYLFAGVSGPPSPLITVCNLTKLYYIQQIITSCDAIRNNILLNYTTSKQIFTYNMPTKTINSASIKSTDNISNIMLGPKLKLDNYTIDYSNINYPNFKYVIGINYIEDVRIYMDTNTTNLSFKPQSKTSDRINTMQWFSTNSFPIIQSFNTTSNIITLNAADNMNSFVTTTDFSYITFINSTLSNIKFQNIKFDYSNFTSCIMSNIDFFYNSFYKANMSNAVMTNVNICDYSTNNNKLVINLSYAILTNVTFININLSNSTFYNVLSTNITILGNTILPSGYKIINNYIVGTRVILTNIGSALKGVNFTDVDLTGVVFTKPISITPAISTMPVVCTKPNAVVVPSPSPYITNTIDLTGVTIKKAVSAYMMGVNLTNANFSYADISNANLSYSNLTGVNLSGCKLLGAILNNIISSNITDDNNTLYPSNWIK